MPEIQKVSVRLTKSFSHHEVGVYASSAAHAFLYLANLAHYGTVRVKVRSHEGVSLKRAVTKIHA